MFFSGKSKLCTLFRLLFRYLCISTSIRWAMLFHCFPILLPLFLLLSLSFLRKSLSKYNLIDFVDFTSRNFPTCVYRTFFCVTIHFHVEVFNSFFFLFSFSCIFAISINQARRASLNESGKFQFRFVYKTGKKSGYLLLLSFLLFSLNFLLNC